MNAIANTVGTPQGAVQALQAGADMALICHTRATQEATRKALRQAVQSGELSHARLNEAVRRVLNAKRQFVTGKASGEESPWNDPATNALEQQIARRAVTVIRSHAPKGFLIDSARPLLLISGHAAVHSFDVHLKRHHTGPFTPCYFSPSKKTGELEDALIHAADLNAQIVVATAPDEPWRKANFADAYGKFVGELHRRVGTRLIMVALRDPYDANRFPDVTNVLCAYSHRPAALAALAEVLYGQYTPTGCLPVSLPG